jgi:hypothetical protein
MRATVRIVLEALNLARDAILIALEIDNAVTLFVSAALMTNRDTTVVIATTLRRLLVEKRRADVGLALCRDMIF